MTTTRRLIAAALLLVLAPSLVLAGMPVRYCVGPSGHHALEFVLEGVAHGGSHESHERAGWEDPDCGGAEELQAFANEEKCSDKALMDTASAPPPIELKKLILDDFVVTGAFPEKPVAPRAEGQRFVFGGPIQSMVDPRMRVRRTVVLLI